MSQTEFEVSEDTQERSLQFLILSPDQVELLSTTNYSVSRDLALIILGVVLAVGLPVAALLVREAGLAVAGRGMLDATQRMPAPKWLSRPLGLLIVVGVIVALVGLVPLVFDGCIGEGCRFTPDST